MSGHSKGQLLPEAEGAEGVNRAGRPLSSPVHCH